jgi:hypothetical protein
MTFLHIFTEEESAKILFEAILPKLLPEGVFFNVYKHQGKKDLEKGLRTTLPSISKIPGSRILITRDQDSGDCKDVKTRLNEIAFEFCQCPYLIRIVCHELESWFLGDLNAIKCVFPRVNADAYRNKAELRNVDKVVSPNEYLLKIIPEYNGRKYLPKLETAEKISPYLDLDNNTSASFNISISAIRSLVDQ